MDYGIGLTLAFYISTAIAAVSAVTVPVFGATSKTWTFGPNLRQAIVEATLFITLSLFFSTFVLFYSIVNLSANLLSMGWRELLSAEMTTGVLTLRATSLLVSVQVLLRAVTYLFAVELQRKIPRLLEPAESEFKRIRSIRSHISPTTIERVVISQFAYYLGIIYCLWYSLHIAPMSRNSLLFSVTSFLLFFIVDDWTIISHYFEALKGRILRSHILRIACVNFALLVCTVALAYQYFGPWIATATAVVLVVLWLYHSHIRSTVEEFLEHVENDPFTDAFTPQNEQEAKDLLKRM